MLGLDRFVYDLVNLFLMSLTPYHIIFNIALICLSFDLKIRVDICYPTKIDDIFGVELNGPKNNQNTK